MKILLIHGAALAAAPGWPWPEGALQARVRHLRSADLPARIAEADWVVVEASCATLHDAWPQVQHLLTERSVPMLAVEPMDRPALQALAQSGTCTQVARQDGSIDAQCRVHLCALSRVAVVARNDTERITRVIFQGS